LSFVLSNRNGGLISPISILFLFLLLPVPVPVPVSVSVPVPLLRAPKALLHSELKRTLFDVTQDGKLKKVLQTSIVLLSSSAFITSCTTTIRSAVHQNPEAFELPPTEYLELFDSSIKYIQGRASAVADGHSRQEIKDWNDLE
jgi:hypothetical protein